MALDYSAAIERAELARGFIDHPYWAIIAKMLSGTIQSETEEMLAGDARLPVNRASVAICRKVLQLPFFDIEQGKMAQTMLELAEARLSAKSRAPKGAEEVVPWRSQRN